MSLNVWLKYQGPFQQLLIGLGSNISNLPRAPHVFDHHQVKHLRNWFIGNAFILPSLFCLKDLAARALLKDSFPVSPQSAPFGSSVFIRTCCTPWSPPKSHCPNECCLLFLISYLGFFWLHVEDWMEPRRSYMTRSLSDVVESSMEVLFSKWF